MTKTKSIMDMVKDTPKQRVKYAANELPSLGEDMGGPMKNNPITSLLKTIGELDMNALGQAITELEEALISVSNQDPQADECKDTCQKSMGSSPAIGALENIQSKIQRTTERIRQITNRLEC